MAKIQAGSYSIGKSFITAICLKLICPFSAKILIFIGEFGMPNGLSMDQNQVNNLFQQIGQLTSGLDTLKVSVERTYKRMTKIEEHVASLNSVADKMKDVGINLDDSIEHQKDMNFIRSLRENDDKKKALIWKVAATVCCVVVLGFAGWVGSSLKEQLFDSVRQELKNEHS